MQEVVAKSVVAYDWLEGAGCVEWMAESRDWFAELERLQTTARERRDPTPYTIGEREVHVFGSGMGTGNQSRLEYRLDWRGVTIAVSNREAMGRQLSNFYFKIPGKACLLIGAEEARDVVHEIIGRIGGSLHDEWFRRVDICMDLPGLCVRDELVPAIEAKQFTGSVKRWKLHHGHQGKTGFTLGNRKYLQLISYNKALEVVEQGEEYRAAMVSRRWGGRVPTEATRVEYTITKGLLAKFGVVDSDGFFERLPDVMERLTNGPYVFFRMTERPIVKGMKNQDRVPTHALWQEIVDRFKRFGGEPQRPLEPIAYGQIGLSRLYKTVIGYLASAAVQMRIPVESLDDGVEVLRELSKRNESDDDDWQRSFLTKARKSGLLEEMISFPFGRAA